MPRLPLAALAAVLLLAPAAHARDETVTSFDGTPIVVHWFPQPSLAAGATAPSVLVGPGWGSGGATDPARDPILRLHAAGYNVLTFDPRGFGQSGGTVTVNSVDHEGRDMQALLSWLATQPEVLLDGPNDPRVGMSGASYGGGIQFITAAIDKRVEAIVPNIAWHSLRTSLYKSELVKLGWAGRLFQVAASRPLDPHIKSTYDAGVATGQVSSEDRAWFIDRGPAGLVGDVTVPTLIQQGTVDTLFTLGEAITNYRILRRADVPVKMLWFCGGHGVCLTKQGDTERVARSTVAWLDRYVKQDASVDTGPRFDWIDQNGKRFTDPDWPVRRGEPLIANGRGRLRLTGNGGAGPAQAPEGADLVAAVAVGITPARARNAVNVRIRSPRATRVIGAPRLKLTYRGRADDERPQRVFAQLVDERTGTVLGNQITPIRLRLDGRRRTVTTALEVVAHSLPRGGRLTLQLVATTVAYAEPQLGGSVRFRRIHIELPTHR
jgi:ABC-2 type transport system ATP-binding protein